MTFDLGRFVLTTCAQTPSFAEVLPGGLIVKLHSLDAKVMVESKANLGTPDPINRADAGDHIALAPGSRQAPDWNITNEDMAAYSREQAAKSAKQAGTQKFIDDFGPLGKIYGDAVADPARFGKFQERMFNMREWDPEAFKGLTQLGRDMRDNPDLKPEQVGTRLADILEHSLGTVSDAVKGNSIDLTQRIGSELLAPYASIMLAGANKMDGANKSEQVKAMVDAFDARLRVNGADRDDTVNGFGNPVQIRGVVYTDGEPGIMVYADGTAGAPSDRHAVP